MSRSSTVLSPPAHLTLRAHTPAPARVELTKKSLAGRLVRTIGCLLVFWGAIPFLLWIPPHYPWIAIAFLGGSYLAYRSWTGRYAVRSFAGLCPRCGSPLSLGRERIIDLPHTLTCYHCHFEPRLEVQLDPAQAAVPARLEHRTGKCVGLWESRWLADVRFIYCPVCHAGAPADASLLARAKAENQAADLLSRLSREGRHLI